MFQSVTYTGFEKHPERRAWVVGVVMPLVEEVLRKEATTLHIYWLNPVPDLAGASRSRIDEAVRGVLADPDAGLLVGQIEGTDAEDYLSPTRAGVLLVLRSDTLPTGWAYLAVPGLAGASSADWLRWLVRSIYITMLSASIDRRIKGFGGDSEPAGVLA